MVIQGQDHMPALMMTFEIGSQQLALEYAHKSSLQIANDKYYQFVLYRQDGSDRTELLDDWIVERRPFIVHPIPDIPANQGQTPQKRTK
jgi:hypothetical protein